MPRSSDVSDLPAQPQPSSHPTIDAVLARPECLDLCQIVPDKFQSSENYALAAWHQREPHTLDSYRGYEAFSEALHQIGEELCRRTFVQEKVGGQVRFLHPSGVRILIAHASLIEENCFRFTSRKGEVSEHPVEQNRVRLGYSLSLFSPEQLRRIRGTALNLWWIADVHGNESISTFLAYPNGLSKQGDVMHCEECKPTGDRDLSEGDVASMDLPPAPPPERAADFDVRSK